MGTHKLERLTSNKRKQSVRQRVFIDSSVTNEAAFNGGADEATRNATTINNREARRMRQRKNANFHSGPASNTKGGSPTQTGAAGFADSQPVAGHQLYKGAVATAAPHTKKQWARAFATVGMAALMAAGSVFGALATSGEPALAAGNDNGVLTETLPITSGANAANSSSVDTSSQTSQDYTLRTANDSTTVITTATVPLTQTVPFNVNGYNANGEIVFSGGATCMYIYPGIDTAVSGTTTISPAEGVDTTIAEFTVEPLMSTVEWLKTGLSDADIAGMFTVENATAERTETGLNVSATVTGDLADGDKIYKVADLENTLEGHCIAIFTDADGNILFGSDSTNVLIDQTTLDSIKSTQGDDAAPLNNVSITISDAPEYADFQIYVMPGL